MEVAPINIDSLQQQQDSEKQISPEDHNTVDQQLQFTMNQFEKIANNTQELPTVQFHKSSTIDSSSAKLINLRTFEILDYPIKQCSLAICQIETPLMSRVQSQQMLATNNTFAKLLKQEINPKPTFEEIVSILNKKGEWRSRDELMKLKNYFEGLSFFQGLKRENNGDDDIIYQCCKEIKYRKYDTDQWICKYGEEGQEFYVIIKGKVDVFTPQTIEVKLTLNDLVDYINKNKEMIVWDRTNRHLLEYANSASNSSSMGLGGRFGSHLNKKKAILKTMKDAILSAFEREIPHHYEFQYLTKSLTLNDGQAFGELALMNKKPDKRNATIKTEEEVHLAYLDKDDFQKVILTLMERKLDQKVDFLKNFRISEGVNRVNLTKLSYFLQDKQFRRRDLLYKQGDIADGIYFIKDGEFEISQRLKTKLNHSSVQKGNQSLLKTIDMRVSIIGANQIIGLEDMVKDQTTFRKDRVQCVSDRAFVYFLSKEDYFTRFYKQLQKKVIVESQMLKEPFLQQRLNSLKHMANKESMAWLMKKERFHSKDQYDEEVINEYKSVINKVQNEELCNLLMKHKLLKKPLLKKERATSYQSQLNDFDPIRHTTKDYLFKMAELYNQLMFNSLSNGQQSTTKKDCKAVSLERVQLPLSSVVSRDAGVGQFRQSFMGVNTDEVANNSNMISLRQRDSFSSTMIGLRLQQQHSTPQLSNEIGTSLPHHRTIQFGQNGKAEFIHTIMTPQVQSQKFKPEFSIKPQSQAQAQQIIQNSRIEAAKERNIKSKTSNKQNYAGASPQSQSKQFIISPKSQQKLPYQFDSQEQFYRQSIASGHQDANPVDSNFQVQMSNTQSPQLFHKKHSSMDDQQDTFAPANLQQNYNNLSPLMKHDQSRTTFDFQRRSVIDASKESLYDSNAFAKYSSSLLKGVNGNQENANNKHSQSTKYLGKRQIKSQKQGTQKSTNTKCGSKSSPTLTMEMIQAHLLKSQNSLLQMLQQRLQEKQQAVEAEQQQQQQYILPNLMEKTGSAMSYPNLQGIQSPSRQNILMGGIGTPTIIGSNDPSSPTYTQNRSKKNNIYFNQFINRKKQ